MESQNTGYGNGAMDGLESRRAKPLGVKSTCTSDLLLRVLALVLTLSAAVLLGVDKQTKTVPLKLVDTLPPLNVPVTAKEHYFSAFVFTVVSNAIACAYAAVSLLISAGGKRWLVPVLIVLDLLITALLFSSTGAAGAIGLLGYQGNSHVQWKKVCNVMGKFCGQAAAAVVLTLLGSTAFLLLVAHAAFRLHKISSM